MYPAYTELPRHRCSTTKSNYTSCGITICVSTNLSKYKHRFTKPHLCQTEFPTWTHAIVIFLSLLCTALLVVIQQGSVADKVETEGYRSLEHDTTPGSGLQLQHTGFSTHKYVLAFKVFPEVAASLAAADAVVNNKLGQRFSQGKPPTVPPM